MKSLTLEGLQYLWTQFKKKLEKKVDTSGGTVTGVTFFKQGARVGDFAAGAGKDGYMHICQIKITNPYANQPIEFHVLQRERLGEIHLQFKSTTGMDPDISYLRKTGNIDAYMSKSATSTWNLYVKKSEGYDNISVTELSKGGYMDSHVTIEWKNTMAALLPTGYITATAEEYNGNAKSATKLADSCNINGMLIDGTANRANYGVCNTGGGTVAKTVNCIGFALVTGAEITIKFINPNTANNPTLNVNDTGAKPIYYNKKVYRYFTEKNDTFTFRYNGAQYDIVGGIDKDVTLALELKGAVSGRVWGNTLNGSTVQMNVTRKGCVFGPKRGYYHLADTYQFEDSGDELSLVLKVDMLNNGSYSGNARMNSCGGILHVYTASYGSRGSITCIDDNVGWEYETKLSDFLGFDFVYGGKNGDDIPSDVGQLWCYIKNSDNIYFAITVISEFSNFAYNDNLWNLRGWIPGDEPEEFLPGT